MPASLLTRKMILTRLRRWTLVPSTGIGTNHRATLFTASSRLSSAHTTSGGRRLRQAHDPFRMAVVGSGPASFYTAYKVMEQLPGAKVDMYESLPVPFGLVRFGVAPDHPEVKNCQDKFEDVAGSPNFTFLGNVSVGEAGPHLDSCVVQISSLLRNYDAVLFAYGASRDRTLGIPGESSLEGIHSAREFVGWYNGLPECSDLAPDLSEGDEAVIIGQGNVALDVARMLLQDVDVLRKTDVAEHALEALSKSRVRRVHVVGRRGPMQAAYTIKEARELMKIPGVGFHPIDESLFPPDPKSLPRPARRLADVVLRGSETDALTANKSWSLDFCLSPSEFLPSQISPTKVGSTVLEHTELSSTFDPDAQARVTGQKTTLPSSSVFRSIGYKSSPLPGFNESGVLFDNQKGIIMNDGRGRVLQKSPDSDETDIVSDHYPGLYCAGWVKRGPTGVIASTMSDAFDTANSIVNDWLSGHRFICNDGSAPPAGWEGVNREVPQHVSPVVQWSDWHKIDRAERERGIRQGKEREKFTSTEEMLHVIS